MYRTLNLDYFEKVYVHIPFEFPVSTIVTNVIVPSSLKFADAVKVVELVTLMFKELLLLAETIKSRSAPPVLERFPAKEIQSISEFIKVKTPLELAPLLQITGPVQVPTYLVDSFVSQLLPLHPLGHIQSPS